MADERRHYLPPSAAVPSAESASSASSNRWAAAPSDVTVGAADRVPLAGAFAPATSPPLTPPTDYVGARPLSAPPDLGVSAAFGMQPLWFTVRDIRADEDYESFYNEFKGNAKLPPPLDPSILRGEFEAFAADVTRRERSGRATAEAFPALMHDTAEPVDATTLSGASTANPQNLVRPRPLPFAATLLRRNDSDASVENLIFRESLKLASQLDREGSDGDLAGSAERRSSDAVGSQVDAGVWQSPPASLLASPPVQLSTISPRPAPTPPVASTNAVAVMPTVTSMPAGVGAPTAPWDHQDVGEVARHGYRRAELEPSSVPYSRGYLRYNGHGGYSAVTPSPAFAAPTAATAAAPYAMPRGGLATSPPVSRHPSRFQQQRHLQGPPVPSAPHAYTLQPGASASGAPRPPLERRSDRGVGARPARRPLPAGQNRTGPPRRHRPHLSPVSAALCGAYARPVRQLPVPEAVRALHRRAETAAAATERRLPGHGQHERARHPRRPAHGGVRVIARTDASAVQRAGALLRVVDVRRERQSRGCALSPAGHPSPRLLRVAALPGPRHSCPAGATVCGNRIASAGANSRPFRQLRHPVCVEPERGAVHARGGGADSRTPVGAVDAKVQLQRGGEGVAAGAGGSPAVADPGADLRSRGHCRGRHAAQCASTAVRPVRQLCYSARAAASDSARAGGAVREHSAAPAGAEEHPVREAHPGAHRQTVAAVVTAYAWWRRDDVGGDRR
eukprot:ctg_92.g68